MIKINKYLSATLVAAFMFLSLVGDNAPLFAATSPEKQLEKGKALFEQEKNDEAMEYFIDVLLSGNRKQVAEANKYVNMIHNRVGGIQNPVEVDVAFKEGEVKRLSDAQTAAEAQAQQDMLNGKCAFSTIAKDCGGVLIEPNANISGRAKLIPPCYIGSGARFSVARYGLHKR